MKHQKSNIKISAIVLTRGDRNLDELKRSLSFCDEILISENASVNSFSEVRNRMAEKSKGEWLLYIDDDEGVTDKLKKEIEKTIETPEFVGYAVPRRNIIFGKEMRHCGLWPDYVIRLIRKDKLLRWTGDLHEQPEIDGKIGYFKEPLMHYKHDNLSDMLEKTNKWSGVEGKLMLEANHPPMNAWRFFTAGAREFWKRMIVEAAFLDGVYGIIYAIYQVYSRLISYSKLWEMQLQNKI